MEGKIFQIKMIACFKCLFNAKDSLREEEREVNHHGSVRSFDADGNEILNELLVFLIGMEKEKISHSSLQLEGVNEVPVISIGLSLLC